MQKELQQLVGKHKNKKIRRLEFYARYQRNQRF